MTAPGKWLRNCAFLVWCSIASPQAPAAQPVAEKPQTAKLGDTNDADPGYAMWSGATKYNKSWIAIDWSALKGPLVEGQRIEVPVDYSLDGSEHYKSTTMKLEALGPRVPKRGVPKPVSFENTQHLYYGNQSQQIKPGRGRLLFPLTVPRSSPQNELLLLASFHDSRGNRWPWDVRASGWFVRSGGYFELETKQPGNLFTYDEPVRVVARLKNVKSTGEKKVLTYKVYDYTKALVAQGRVPFGVERDKQEVPVQLDLARRGTFLFQAEVEGWETRETIFCRVPDLAALTQGKPTRLGFTGHAAPHTGFRTPEVFLIARRLGLSSCRLFTEWRSIEPGPGRYAIEHWDPFIESACAAGIQTVITIYDPPPWAMPRGRHAGYQMFECNLDAFKEMVATVSRRYKGKIWGWEWLNEITPGGTPDYVSDYVKLCRAGVESARAVDPSLHSILAGGLWPRGFRLDVLSAGAGNHVDVLPVHYGNGTGIEEAREDLDTYGHNRAAVWENESCAFVIDWNCPGLDWVSESSKCNWVLTQWTDELAAGCEKLIYFGGEGATTGYGDYMLSDFTPLPVAATLAVFAEKTFEAKPVGVFSTAGHAGLFHLFERGGKPILVVSSSKNAQEEIPLFVGAESVRITDYQGNETVLPTRSGIAYLPLAPLRCFVEGADLNVLKSYLVPSIEVASAGSKRDRSASTPRISMLRGRPGAIPVRLDNLYSTPLRGTLRVDLPAGWMREEQVSFALEPHQTKIVSVSVTVPETAPLESSIQRLTVTFDREGIPPATKPFAVAVIAPGSVGNLLKNGDFEQLEHDGKTPAHWRGTNARVISSEGLGPGLGKHVLKFSGASEWAHQGQAVKLEGGMTYLYTAWVWNQGMEGGSNINQAMKDGSSRPLYDNHVINIGDKTASWQVFTCRYQAPEGLVEAAFVPVVRGAGAALYDNLRVTVFEGTDFAAEAIKVKNPPVIDGKLDDWDGRCPIPLIGRNQARILQTDYAWSPENQSGAAYLRWDSRNLYVALDLLDQVHHPSGQGESVIEGDSVILAFDPTHRSSEAASHSFAYYLSSQRPAGGSGRHTLWRPRQHAADRPYGHLARDSSVYEIAVKAEGPQCIYELKIPWSELGIPPFFGGKFGFSIQSNDNDGVGQAAQMNWGGGLAPTWRPASLGAITLIE